MEQGTVYNRLPVLRAARGLSRQDLAEALGVHYQTVGYLERGEYNPSLFLALRTCEFFGLPMEEVFATTPFGPEQVREGGAAQPDTGRADRVGRA